MLESRRTSVLAVASLIAALLAGATAHAAEEAEPEARSRVRFTDPGASDKQPLAQTSAIIYQNDLPELDKPAQPLLPAAETDRDPPPALPPALLRVAKKWRTRLDAPERLAPEAPAEPEPTRPVLKIASDPAQPEPEVIEAAPSRFDSPAPLASVDTSIALPGGTLPEDVASLRNLEVAPTIDPRMDGRWAESGHSWAATGLCHRPLYYEEVSLERYGYTVGPLLQPVVSGGRFVVNTLALPYKMALYPHKYCEYTLGHYRPGSRAPYRWHRPPLRLPASVAEACVVVGLVFLIP